MKKIFAAMVILGLGVMVGCSDDSGKGKSGTTTATTHSTTSTPAGDTKTTTTTPAKDTK